MIAEWLYKFTKKIGGWFNNGVGIEDGAMLTGITILWVLLIMLTAIAICTFIFIYFHEKEILEHKKARTIQVNIIADLEKELDIFKLAFYTLWKCCNSSEVLTDIQKESGTYIEFKCGLESVFIPASEQEIESIKQACKILDMDVREV